MLNEDWGDRPRYKLLIGVKRKTIDVNSHSRNIAAPSRKKGRSEGRSGIHHPPEVEPNVKLSHPERAVEPTLR